MMWQVSTLGLALALAASATQAQARAPLSEQEIRQTISGKRIYLKTPLGGEFPLFYRTNGRVDGSGDAVGLGRFMQPEGRGALVGEGRQALPEVAELVRRKAVLLHPVARRRQHAVLAARRRPVGTRPHRTLAPAARSRLARDCDRFATGPWKTAACRHAAVDRVFTLQ